MPAWLEFNKEIISDRIISFGEKILGLENVNDADMVIYEFKTWIKAVGCPVKLSELGIENPDTAELIRQAKKLAVLWNIANYSDEDMISVYNLCI